MINYLCATLHRFILHLGGTVYIKAGGDVNRIFFISEEEKMLNFSDERILQATKETNAQVLIFDPLTSYIGSVLGHNSDLLIKFMYYGQEKSRQHNVPAD